MALESYCAACTYLKETSDSYGKYYCERKGEYHYATDPKCYSFCEAYSRSNYARENMYDNSRGHSSSSCYITTTLCNILGFPNDSYYLETLRKYRDQYLKQDISNWPLLMAYDTIGPIISSNLLQENNKEELAKTLFNSYIVTAVTAIEENKNEIAKNIYISMTTALVERYNINLETIEYNPEKVDITTLGHARKRTKTY